MRSIRSPKPTFTWPTAVTRRQRKSSRKRCKRTQNAPRAAAGAAARSDFTPAGTLIMGERQSDKTVTRIDFNLDATGGGEANRLGSAAMPASANGGLDFDISLDLGGEQKKPETDKTVTSMDLSSISLDLGAA